MYQITPVEKIQFENLGYLVIPMPVNSNDITSALEGVKKMRHEAIHKNTL